MCLLSGHIKPKQKDQTWILRRPRMGSVRESRDGARQALDFGATIRLSGNRWGDQLGRSLWRDDPALVTDRSGGFTQWVRGSRRSETGCWPELVWVSWEFLDRLMALVNRWITVELEVAGLAEAGRLPSSTSASVEFPGSSSVV